MYLNALAYRGFVAGLRSNRDVIMWTVNRSLKEFNGASGRCRQKNSNHCMQSFTCWSCCLLVIESARIIGLQRVLMALVTLVSSAWSVPVPAVRRRINNHAYIDTRWFSSKGNGIGSITIVAVEDAFTALNCRCFFSNKQCRVLMNGDWRFSMKHIRFQSRILASAN